ncbi:MAG: hypothetical protein EBV03_04700 [Proteobacteria bacterium]|nr:hypothetical protein [Pseudomonadota bacterium]
MQALRYSVSIREIMFSYGACGFGDEPGVDDLQQKADDSIAAAESAFSAFLKDNNIIASPPLVLNLGEGGRLEVGGNHPDAQRVEDMLNAGTTDTNLKKQLREAIELKQHEAMVKLHNVYIHQFDDAMTLQGNTAAQAVNTQFQSITATAQFRFVQSFSGLAMQVSHESLGQWLENARKALAQTVAQARGSLAEPEQKQAAAA